MIFGGPKKIKLGLEKWFAWYPVRLNKFTRSIGSNHSEQLPHYRQFAWLENVYRSLYLSDIISKYTYQILPDHTHPDFKKDANDVLKEML